MKYIGVLALQGGFSKHIEACRSLGLEAKEFRDAEDLGNLSGIILPGGESTTIGMLLERRGLLGPLAKAIELGLPVFGTCAGAILLAKDIVGSRQLRLGVLDISIERNAYGSQVDSFEAKLDIQDKQTGMSAELEAVFIRAPRIEKVGSGVSILGSFGDHPVIVRQGSILAATFHPELSGNTSIHRYFAQSIVGLKL